MARGLKGSWKLPVFYAFDCQMTVEILNDVITELSNAGFPVVAVVCDGGSTNRTMTWEYQWVSITPYNTSTDISHRKIYFLIIKL